MAMRDKPFWRNLRMVLAVIGALTVVAGVVFGGVLAVGWLTQEKEKSDTTASFSPFYAAPTEVPADLGTIIRSEPLGWSVPGGTGYRIVYTSQDHATGAPVAVSGMVWLPDAPAPPEGRKVFAYAHGTVGGAPQCAPSRTTSPGTYGWLEPALQQGYVVAWTDYYGLGMAGPNTYLVGQQEARDVVNSVRAARNFPGANAGSDWVVYGTSQGGHASLWTANLAQQLAPELPLKGVLAAVPAAELGSTFSVQWDTAAAWAIAPQALPAWEAAYPDRNFRAVLSQDLIEALPGLAGQCVIGNALEGEFRQFAGQKVFTSNPLDDPAWAQTMAEQTPAPPPASLPMYLAVGTSDKVVLAGANATLQNSWCSQGRPMTSLWMENTGHVDSGVVAGADAVFWAVDRFADRPVVDSCPLGIPAPVVPIPNPVPGPAR